MRLLYSNRMGAAAEALARAGACYYSNRMGCCRSTGGDLDAQRYRVAARSKTHCALDFKANVVHFAATALHAGCLAQDPKYTMWKYAFIRAQLGQSYIFSCFPCL